jgi:hypothetical protein
MFFLLLVKERKKDKMKPQPLHYINSIKKIKASLNTILSTKKATHTLVLEIAVP